MFDGILGCKWRWHRYEWKSRSSINAHGAARFKNDPVLVDLTRDVHVGHRMEKLIDNPNITTETMQSYLELIEKGKEAEKGNCIY